MKTLYTARAAATAGRDGSAETDDRILSVKLARPGSNSGTNPEQLFACGYAACFGGAVEAVAKKQGLNVSPVTVNSEVGLNQDDSGGLFLNVILDVSLPTLDTATAQQVVESAHQMCPYSKATRGNINVELRVNQQLPKTAA